MRRSLTKIGRSGARPVQELLILVDGRTRSPAALTKIGRSLEARIRILLILVNADGWCAGECESRAEEVGEVKGVGEPTRAHWLTGQGIGEVEGVGEPTGTRLAAAHGSPIPLSALRSSGGPRV